MTQAESFVGKCCFCDNEYTRKGIARHISACAAYQAAIEMAEQGEGARQTIYHLYIKDHWDDAFWLRLEMNGAAHLSDLDSYLRAIWLECCGHLSRFGDWREDEIPKHLRADQVFEPGMRITHLYDFGTTSKTLIRVTSTREGKPLTAHPITLLARNEMPHIPCRLCDQPAAWWCYECAHEFDNGMLCLEHEVEHQELCGIDTLLPIVNSPRICMCGYAGPAEPLY